MRLLVRHSTVYSTSTSVTLAYHQAHLTPRETPRQRVLESSVVVNPAPHDQSTHNDAFGNHALYFSIEAPHNSLEVSASSVIELRERSEPLDWLASWESARRLAETTDALAEFVLSSPLAPVSDELRDFAATSFPPGGTFLGGLNDLTQRIFREFSYSPGWSTISTPVSDVLALRSGVCQDFAHLSIAAARSMGLAARYVSGYIETFAGPDAVAQIGAAASHAWASVCGPDGQWIDIDPTNGLLDPTTHVTVAWGRDFSDVTPLKGVVTSHDGLTAMTVAVDVRRVSGS